MSFDEAMRDMPVEGIDEYLGTRDGVGKDTNSMGNQVYSVLPSFLPSTYEFTLTFF
jgi:hypothetical protein